VVAIATSLSDSVNVRAVESDETTILVTTAVVDAGTVYRVVVVVVVAAPLNSALLVVVAISYYLPPIKISVSSSCTLPTPFRTISSSPEIVVIVAPDVTVVDPSVGAEYPVTVAHWTPVPVDCRYCPFVPDVAAAVSVPVKVAFPRLA